MVVGSDTLAELPERSMTNNDSRIVFTIKDVIDMGAPRMYSRQRRWQDDAIATPQGGVAASGKLRGRPSNISSKQRAGRRVSLNSSLSPKKLSASSYRRVREQQPKKNFEVKKVAKIQSGGVESQKRVNQRKRGRLLVPNSRLYQAPKNRPRPAPPPPQRPLRPWSPPPTLAPQQTASQLALHLSTRIAIPFKQFLHQGKDIPLKSREVSRREKTRAERFQAKSPSGCSPIRIQENLQWIPKDSLACTKRRTKRTLSVPQHNGARKKNVAVKKPLIDLSSLTQYIEPTPFQDYAVSPKPQRYTPRSQHLRLTSLTSTTSTLAPAARLHKPPSLATDPSMASTPQSSLTAEDGSDGNESLSAPSEYLAEFLSAIMSRKYADALKYCRLILYYEPDNATARGFYPLLRDKVADLDGKVIHPSTHEGKVHGSSTSEESGSSGADIPNVTPDEVEEGSESESDESVASLSLDSSGKSSRSVSPAARGTDSTSEGSVEPLGVTAAEVSATPACWLTDDNGNPSSYTHKPKDNEDEENDNAAGDHKLLLKDPTLQQLRAQFACSIK